MRSSGGYAYFETSYKAANRVFSSAALESGSSGDLRIQVMDDLNGVAGGNYSLSISSASAPTATASAVGVFKQSYSVSSLGEVVSVVPSSAHLISPNISVTGPKGICLNFYYNLDGLSAEKLRILVKGIDSEANQTLWESSTESEGKWIKAAVAYAYETTHQVRRWVTYAHPASTQLSALFCVFSVGDMILLGGSALLLLRRWVSLIAAAASSTASATDALLIRQTWMLLLLLPPSYLERRSHERGRKGGERPIRCHAGTCGLSSSRIDVLT